MKISHNAPGQIFGQWSVVLMWRNQRADMGQSMGAVSGHDQRAQVEGHRSSLALT